MANVRVVSFAPDGTLSSIAPFTLFHRTSAAKTWNAEGICNTKNIHKNLTKIFKKVCDLPTRTIIRADDGSGLELSIEHIIRIIEKETVLGRGKLKCLYLVVYETDPRPPLDDEVERAIWGEPKVVEKEESRCCILQ